MTILTEGTHAGEFIVSEATVGSTGVSRSREAIKVLSGQDLAAGAVLGATITGTATAVAGADNTGNGVMGAITVSGAAKPGKYTLIITAAATDAGEFAIENPDGVTGGYGDVAAAYATGGLAFTLADGAADYIVGDSFVITVAMTSRKYAEYNSSAVDGTATAVAILFDAVDASAGDANGVALVRECEFHLGEVVWKATQNADDKAAAVVDLETIGVIAR